MDCVELDPNKVREILTELGRHVEEITGWPINSHSLKTHLIPLSSLPAKDAKGAAFYTSVDNGLYLIAERNKDDASLYGNIAHELTHRTQHQEYPSLFKRANSLIIKLNEAEERGKFLHIDDIISTYAHVGLLEGHAEIVEEEVLKRYNLKSIRKSYQKEQYKKDIYSTESAIENGVRIFSHFFPQYGQDFTNQMFSLPPVHLIDIFGPPEEIGDVLKKFELNRIK